MTLRAGFIGGLFLTVFASVPGAIAGALMARVSHRVVRSASTTRWLSPLNVSCIVTLVAAGLISYIAFDKAITGSVVTGISTIGPLGPLLAVPAAWYFWHMAKQFSFLL
jgi:predicted membrane protein